jgi:hypothetical protein
MEDQIANFFKDDKKLVWYSALEIGKALLPRGTGVGRENLGCNIIIS